MKNKTIAFDADDTLWVNETIFTHISDKFTDLLRPYAEVDRLQEQLYQTQVNNLHLFGYGIKGFTLSMIETALEFTQERISGRDLHQIMGFCKDMLAHPVEVLPGVAETLLKLSQDYRLVVITKGDLFDQETKIARSGLADLFDVVEIVSEKNERTYAQVFKRNNIAMADLVMVGNSVKSDILPICALGGRAVYIPFHTTWVHETVSDEQAAAYHFYKLGSIVELPDLLTRVWP